MSTQICAEPQCQASPAAAAAAVAGWQSWVSPLVLCIYIYIYVYVCMCIYVYIYLSIYIYIYIYLFIYIDMCEYVFGCKCKRCCVYTCTSSYEWAYIYIYIYSFIYYLVCVHTCTSRYVRMHTHICISTYMCKPISYIYLYTVLSDNSVVCGYVHNTCTGPTFTPTCIHFCPHTFRPGSPTHNPHIYT